MNPRLYPLLLLVITACGGYPPVGTAANADIEADVDVSAQGDSVASDAGLRALTPKLEVDQKQGDLGPWPCSVGVSKAILFQNSGGVDLSVEATVSGSAMFTLGPATQWTIPPGGLEHAVVTADVSSGVAGVAQHGILTLASNDPLQPNIEIPLSVTPYGASLVVVPSTLDFGLVAVGQTQQLEGSLKNVGDTAIQVKAAPINNPQLTAIGPTDTLQPGGSAKFLITFKPTVVGKVAVELPMWITGALCGDSISSIPIAAEGSAGP